MNLSDLQHAVSNASNIRLVVDLATLNEDGLVHPPTYAPLKEGGPPHIAMSKGWADGSERNLVILDSVQSQANRVELAILNASQNNLLAYPDIRLSFPDNAGEPDYSVLQLSHRIYDVTLQCATLNKTPFFETARGQRLRASRPADATALFELAPITLILGAWDSHRGGGTQAAKLPRLLTSEIVGIDAVMVGVSATKTDPMDIRKNAAELILTPGSQRHFEIKKDGSKDKGKRPSELGFGGVISVDQQRAVRISKARQTSVLSCSGLRQLHFPGGKVGQEAERDMSARTVLAALGLYGLLAQNESGYLLRSRCELLPLTEVNPVEVFGRSRENVTTFDLGAAEALGLLQAALVNAAEYGLQWGDCLALEADDRLTELVRRSRIAAGITEEGAE